MKIKLLQHGCKQGGQCPSLDFKMYLSKYIYIFLKTCYKHIGIACFMSVKVYRDFKLKEKILNLNIHHSFKSLGSINTFLKNKLEIYLFLFIFLY